MSKTLVPIKIITCPQWGARPAKVPPVLCDKSDRIIQHHTAGHHPEIDTPGSESIEEAMAYARRIQDYHMDHNGWNDSGHNFLVCRNGAILQGRWYTVTAIQNGHMVISAHCPTQNDQVGIEHEHVSGENPTDIQIHSSATLDAWIAGQYGRTRVLPHAPHRKYIATTCPDTILKYLPTIRDLAQQILDRARGL